MTVNTKLQKTDTILATGKGCLPTPLVITGTITSVAKVVTGIGTLFNKELMKGMWIYSSLNDAVREVDYVNSDTELVLKSAFVTPLVGETVKNPYAGYYRSVSVVNTSAGPGTFNEVALAATDPAINDNNDYGLAPIAYNATGTTFLINTGT